MYGPLSAKQLREDAKFQVEQARKNMELRQKLQQQEELHQIKIQAEQAKVHQNLAQKDDIHRQKVKEMGGRASSTVPPLGMGIPQPTNPEAGPNDVVPALLAPGEAVIPAPAAQDPDNKPLIAELVQQGREMQGYQKGIRNVKINKPKKVGGKGSQNKVVPKLPHINMKGYQMGTTKVPFTDDLIGYLIMQESQGFHRGGIGSRSPEDLTRSPRGALGLTQIMPHTAASPGFGARPIDLQNSTEHDQINFTREYLTGLSERFGDTEKAIAAYNWGPGNFQRHLARAEAEGRDWREGLPQETATYLDRVYKPYAESKRDAVPSTPEVVPQRRLSQEEINRLSPTDRRAYESGRLVFGGTATPPAVPPAVPPVPQQRGRTPRDWRAAGYDMLTGTNRDRGEVDPRSLTPAEARARGYDVLTGKRENVQGAVREVPPLPQEEIKPHDPVVTVEIDGRTTEATQPQLDQVDSTVTDLMSNDLFNQSIANFKEALAREPEQKDSIARSFSDYLTNLFKNIYSNANPNALFNDQDVARFALTFVGGLLTGGSVGGSLRWSGLDVLKQSDARRAAIAQQQGEARKERDKEEVSLRDKFAEALKNTNVPPALRAQAHEVWREIDSIEDPRKRARAMRDLLEQVNKNAISTEPEPKPGKPENVFINGQPVQMRTRNGENEVLVGKEWKPFRGRALSEGEFRAQRQDIVKSVSAIAEPLLREFYGNDNKKIHFESEAKGYGEIFAALHEELGDVFTPSTLAMLSETTIRQALEHQSKGKQRLTPEGLRKAFFGNAVITLSPSKAEFWRLPDGSLPPPPVQAAVGAIVQDTIKDMKRVDPNMNLNDALNVLESRWQGLDPKVRKKYEDYSKGVPGTNGFLYWLKQKAPDK